MIPHSKRVQLVPRPRIEEPSRQQRYLPRRASARRMVGELAMPASRAEEVLWWGGRRLARTRASNAIRNDKPARALDWAHPAGR